MNKLVKKIVLPVLSTGLAALIVFSKTGTMPVWAEEVVHKAYSNNGSKFDKDIEDAIAKGANAIEVTSNYNKVGAAVVGGEINHIYAVLGNSFSNKYPKELGRAADETFTFAKDANILVENIDFNLYRAAWGGVKVLIEEGANVTFVNCIFDITPENAGRATFDSCTFSTGQILNNGIASYVNMKEPENIGSPKVAETPLYMSLSSEEMLLGVVDQELNAGLDVTLDGSNKEKAEITANIEPGDSGILVSVNEKSLVFSQKAVKAGDYVAHIVAKALKEDGNEERVEKTVPIKIYEKISARLTGHIQDYIVGVGSADATSSASGGGGAYISNENPGLQIEVKEGENDYISLKDYRNTYLNTQVSLKLIDKETEEEANIGLTPMYLLDTIKLEGTPNKAGNYGLVAVVNDGIRSVTTDVVDFTVYDPNITLTERFQELNPKQRFWNMAPWNIPNVGNSVVPISLVKIQGSNEHGLYGTIGSYTKFDSETLTIVEGADLTLKNMKINSNVRVIVEKGAKLTLENSVIYGPLEVRGGTISTKSENPDWKSTINNQLILEDGSIIENLDVVSHARYLTDGNLTIEDPKHMVIVNGNVRVKGENTLAADKGGNAQIGGQTALLVNGKLILEEGSYLKALGGGDKTMFHVPMGGNGIELKDGSIEGQGSLEAIGGIGSNFVNGHTKEKRGGDGIMGQGSVNVKKLIAQGGDGSILDESLNVGHALGIGKGGDALADTVKVKAEEIQVAGGKGTEDGSFAVTPLEDVKLGLRIEPIENPNLPEPIKKMVVEAYNISLVNLKDNTVVKPTEEVEVKVELKKVKSDKVKIYHQKEDKSLEEIKDFTVDGNFVNFKSADFSPFYFANEISPAENESPDANTNLNTSTDVAKSSTGKTPKPNTDNNALDATTNSVNLQNKPKTDNKTVIQPVDNKKLDAKKNSLSKNTKKAAKTVNKTSPKTGDYTKIAVWIGAMGLAFLVLIGLVIYKRRK